MIIITIINVLFIKDGYNHLYMVNLHILMSIDIIICRCMTPGTSIPTPEPA